MPSVSSCIQEVQKALVQGLSEVLCSMKEKEQIIYAFDGSYIEINNENDIVRSYIALITNEKFYYAGCEGNAYLNHMKAGSVELQDVHSISLGNGTTTSSPYVKFETKNDNYTLHTFCNIRKIKIKLEEAIRNAKSGQQPSGETTSPLDSANAIIKFKELLDSGIISQEEFDAKKKQLLGL